MGIFSGPMDFLQNEFFPNPAKSAQPYLDKIPGTIKPYYDPYVNAGKWAMPELQKHFSEMMDDPDSIINRLGAGYKESPGYQRRLNQGMQAIGNAEAAGGMAGTRAHDETSAKFAEDLASEDYDKYLQNALGLLGMGTQGAMGVGQLGYGASSDLATNLAQTLMNQAGLNYTGQANTNNMRQGLFRDALSLLSGGGK